MPESLLKENMTTVSINGNPVTLIRKEPSPCKKQAETMEEAAAHQKITQETRGSTDSERDSMEVKML